MKTSSQTLLQQMHLDELEIEHRLELLHLGHAELQQLYMCRGIIQGEVAAIVDEFYRHQSTIPEVSFYINDADTLERLHKAMHGYVMDLFSGHCNYDYVNSRLRIGLVHKRIGVEPKLFLSALNHLKRLILARLEQYLNDPDRFHQIGDILDRLLHFDITLIVDTHLCSLLADLEATRQRTEHYARDLEKKVAERTRLLEELSRRDPLTGLYNQRVLMDALNRELMSARRHDTCVSLLYFDVDGFKEINDRDGHLAGDEVLRAVAGILTEVAREVDTPCRYGGDEFCLVLQDANIAGARAVAERLMELFARCYSNISLSIGIAGTGPGHFVEIDTLIGLADRNMYKAKKIPGNHICFDEANGVNGHRQAG